MILPSLPLRFNIQITFLYLIALTSFLFIKIFGFYICIAEILLPSSFLLCPSASLRAFKSKHILIAIILLVFGFLLSSLYNQEPFNFLILFRYLSFVMFLAITRELLSKVSSLSLSNIVSTTLVLLGVSLFLSRFGFQDGFIDFLLQNSRDLSTNSLWKLIYSGAVFFCAVGIMLRFRISNVFVILILFALASLNFYLDSRSTGLFFLVAMTFALFAFLPKQVKTNGVSWVILGSSFVLSILTYQRFSINDESAFRRSVILTDQYSGNLLDYLNRSSLESTLTSILVNPIFGHTSIVFSTHSMLMSVWAIAGLFAFVGIVIIVLPILSRSLFYALTSRESVSSKAAILLLFFYCTWNLLFSPLASFRALWGIAFGLLSIVSIPSPVVSSKHINILLV